MSFVITYVDYKYERTYLKMGKSKRILSTDGYMTIEATLIMPIVLYVCIFAIYTGFYWYDRCLIKQDIYRAALKGSSIYRQSNQESYNAAFEAMEELTDKKYIAVDWDYDITVQGNVSVLATGRIEMPFSGLIKLTGEEYWKIQEKVESKCINPVIFIRMCRGLVSLTEKDNEEKGADYAGTGIY